MLEGIFNQPRFKQSHFKQPRFKEAILKSQINDMKLLRAKDYPITKLYNGELKRSGKTLLGLCPFHSEKIASFAIYPESNSWYCHGKCGSGGDVIAFYMKLKGVSFQEALEVLVK